MNKELIISNEIEIKANANTVWNTLIDPAKIKIYFFGTDTVCDWKEGSSLFFRGEYQGKIYEDHGVIQKSVPDKLLQYTYHSTFSGLSDLPENYSIVTYELTEFDDHTSLKVIQSGFANEQAQEHSNTAWQNVLKKIKELAESN